MRMISRSINGRMYNVPIADDGTVDSDDLREAAQIPSNRTLVLSQKDRGNYIVNPGQKVQVRPEQQFVDHPNIIRGV